MNKYFTTSAYIDREWQDNVLFSVDDIGMICEIEVNCEPGCAMQLNGPVIPGMPNLHSHAFQRAMAGLAEVAYVGQSDSFWSWRDKMYGMLDKLTPEQLHHVARYLYIEMLKAGYTSVAEFHYVHHDQQGKPYFDLTEMSRQISHAAEQVGIGVTILPALYSWSGFGQQQPSGGQRRFINHTDQYLNLWSELADQVKSKPTQRVGLCFHSLRAVSTEQMNMVLSASDRSVPIHIHIAEQQKEIDDCLAWHKMRPVEYLYSQHDVDKRWCLVHATHLSDKELHQIAVSGAIVGLCTTTEANLGDGFFPLPAYLKKGGRFGIGSDSHISVNVTEELRWLEYEHRLIRQQRNCLLVGESGSTGEMLYQQALNGGAQALGQPVGSLRVGARADWLVLDNNNPFVAASQPSVLFDRWLFGNTNEMIRDVMVAGKWVIRDGKHRDELDVASEFTQTLKMLF